MDINDFQQYGFQLIAITAVSLHLHQSFPWNTSQEQNFLISVSDIKAYLYDSTYEVFSFVVNLSSHRMKLLGLGEDGLDVGVFNIRDLSVDNINSIEAFIKVNRIPKYT